MNYVLVNGELKYQILQWRELYLNKNVYVDGYAPRRRTTPSLSRSVIIGLAAGRYLNSLEYL